MKIDKQRISQLSQLGNLIKTKQLNSSNGAEIPSAPAPTAAESDQPQAVIYLGYSDEEQLGDHQ
jgi:hypothetical protein